MKKKDVQLINRGLDGELDAEERKEFERLRRENPDAAEFSRAVESIGDHLRTESIKTEIPDVTVAWQDIRREIRQSERKIADGIKSNARLRWAGAMAALLVLGVLAMSSWRLLSDNATDFVWGNSAAPSSRVDWVETEIPGATTIIYTDTETELTVIWMDVAQNGEARDT